MKWKTLPQNERVALRNDEGPASQLNDSHVRVSVYHALLVACSMLKPQKRQNLLNDDECFKKDYLVQCCHERRRQIGNPPGNVCC